ncbi:uncharacterized protein BT62DRAFT_1000090 [Guyanagaster necrorhizus]|uniref:Uncharacterized protein n=1 Tax=Guyanagaster necrorhizus TaxID=856835 RepID=A0A9P7W566_9AGAR|nr:uncharacterized protein BT62DRAFT_1000090 [Guyanagaster necrorhizus MCA 3950]KAG7452352.1 hypothetical protein BT62DRAFT_1000090 [Guyanagaster necrorhizus MCA 3950]
MSNSNPATSPISEGEMNIRQAGLVDSCFEEDQYEAGLAVLDQLRSPHRRPTASHIRQLLYMALSPPSFQINEVDITASPTKINKGLKFRLTTEAIRTAQRLLLSFALTNTPKGLFRTIPGYEKAVPSTEGDDDSVVARDSQCIIRSKSCWSLLKPGFIKSSTPAPQSSGSKRRCSQPDEEDDSVMSKNAWPTLEWFITIFEKDESMTEAGQPPYSELLLSQIPPTRDGKGPRWELSTPLDVVFCCLKQENESYRKLGARLMTLLINLSLTIHLDYSIFVSSVFSRLSTTSTDSFVYLMLSLAPFSSVLRFKISLCQHFLRDHDRHVNNLPARPKPQARAPPRARGSNTTTLPFAERPATEATVQFVARKVALPSAKEIARLAGLEATASSVSIPRIQFELVQAYTLLQRQCVEEERDQDWLAGVYGDKLTGAFGGACEEGRQLRQVLKTLTDA